MKKVYVKASKNKELNKYIDSQIDKLRIYMNGYNGSILQCLDDIALDLYTDDLEDVQDTLSEIIDYLDKIKKYAETVNRRIDDYIKAV